MIRTYQSLRTNLGGLLIAIGLVSGVVSGRAQVAHADTVIKLHLATYNVENLFDSVHDADPDLPNGKEDFTFLPLNHPLKRQCDVMQDGFYKTECQQTDWSLERATWKLDNMSNAISFLKDKPDILTLAEIENEKVVGYLAKKMGYGNSFSVTTSPDHRGIDVGLIYNKAKLKLVKVVQIKIDGEGLVKATRNILRAEFKFLSTNGRVVNGGSLFVYANHWPSQAAPAGARMLAAKTLKEDIDQIREHFEGTAFFVAMGDFNTIPSDSPHPFNDLIINKTTWPEALVDSETWARQKKPTLNQTLLPGSYWFAGEKNWNKLDHIFVSQNLTDDSDSDLDPASFFIFKDNRLMAPAVPTSGPWAGKNIMVPVRTNSLAANQQEMGYSDHLPVGIDIKLKLKNDGL